MPTSLQRIQVLCQPDQYETIKLLAQENRRSLSAMVGELISYALEQDIYKDQLKPKPSTKEQLKNQTVEAAIGGANLNDFKIKKLLKLLEALEE